MIVTETSTNIYRVELTDLELQSFMVIVAGMADRNFCNVSDAISHILTFCSDRCFLTVQEPDLSKPDISRDGFLDR